MRLLTWVSIYHRIDNRIWEIKLARGRLVPGSGSGSSPRQAPNGPDGIAVMRDPAALEYQRLEHIQRHVGCHLFAQRDRERGMKSARCYYSRRLERVP